jgi:hypothetical protein
MAYIYGLVGRPVQWGVELVVQAGGISEDDAGRQADEVSGVPDNGPLIRVATFYFKIAFGQEAFLLEALLLHRTRRRVCRPRF